MYKYTIWKKRKLPLPPLTYLNSNFLLQFITHFYPTVVDLYSLKSFPVDILHENVMRCVDFLDIILIKVERSFTCSRKTMTIMLMMWLNKKYALFTKKAMYFLYWFFYEKSCCFVMIYVHLFLWWDEWSKWRNRLTY